MKKRRLWIPIIVTLLGFLLLLWNATVYGQGSDSSNEEDTWHHYYLPLVTKPDTLVRYTIPVSQTRSVSSLGNNHAGAYAPDGSGVFNAQDDLLITHVDPHDLDIYYLIERSYFEVPLPAMSEITKSTLQCTTVTALSPPDVYGYDPLPAPIIALHVGTWTDWSIDPADLWAAWDSTKVVGTLDTATFYQQWDGQTVILPLDATYLRPNKVLRLSVRDSEDHVDLRGQGRGRVLDLNHCDLILKGRP